MKLISLILFGFLLACSPPKEGIPQSIILKENFVNILQHVHLAEERFELNKKKGIENAKNYLYEHRREAAFIILAEASQKASTNMIYGAKRCKSCLLMLFGLRRHNINAESLEI